MLIQQLTQAGCCSHNIHFKTTCHIFHLCHILSHFITFIASFSYFESASLHSSLIICIYILFTINSSRSISSLPTQSYSSFLLFIMLGSLPKISSQMILIQFCIYLFTVQILFSIQISLLSFLISNLFELHLLVYVHSYVFIPIIRISLLFH